MKTTSAFFAGVLCVAALCTGCGGGDDTPSAALPAAGSGSLVTSTPVGTTSTVVTATPTTTTTASTATTVTTTPTAVVASNLIVSSAVPATANGTLNKTAAAVLYESTIGGSTGNFSSTGPNDFCRVAAYDLPNSGDGLTYNLEVVFSKTSKVASYAMLSRSTSGSGTFAARAVEPNLGGITVDVVNRRIGFSGIALGVGGTYSATLNGSFEYITNGSVPDRANCG